MALLFKEDHTEWQITRYRNGTRSTRRLQHGTNSSGRDWPCKPFCGSGHHAATDEQHKQHYANDVPGHRLTDAGINSTQSVDRQSDCRFGWFQCANPRKSDTPTRTTAKVHGLQLIQEHFGWRTESIFQQITQSLRRKENPCLRQIGKQKCHVEHSNKRNSN